MVAAYRFTEEPEGQRGSVAYSGDPLTWEHSQDLELGFLILDALAFPIDGTGHRDSPKDELGHSRASS